MFDDVSVTVVSATRRWFVSADINPFVPAVTLCDGGVSDSVGIGIWIEPLVSARPPFDCVSVVVPPWLLSCVVEESSVSVIGVPGVADDESWKTMCATWSPGSAAFDVNGIGLVLSEKLTSSEIVPGVAGDVSNAGERLAVMPARLKVTDDTAAAGEYDTLMLSDWIFEPAGRSTPSGVPEVSRMKTGTSTVGPSAVTVWTVTTSCAAATAANARLAKTASSIFFIGVATSNLSSALAVPAPRSSFHSLAACPRRRWRVASLRCCSEASTPDRRRR